MLSHYGVWWFGSGGRSFFFIIIICFRSHFHTYTRTYYDLRSYLRIKNTTRIGRKIFHCSFISVITSLVPGLPQPPQDCRIDNQSSNGLGVICSKGDDGGLEQHFLLEAIETDNGLAGSLYSVPVFKVLGSEPVFLLQGLEPGRKYELRIHAVNGKGQSEPPIVLPFMQLENTSSKLHVEEGKAS